MRRPLQAFRGDSGHEGRDFEILVACWALPPYFGPLVHALARSRPGVLPGESDKFGGDLKPDEREQLQRCAQDADHRML